MDYSINQLAKLSGVSARTLRYYDEFALLKPKRVASNGYRIYGTKEVDQLQQILFYKSLGLSLDEIKTALYSEKVSLVAALEQQRELLQAKRRALDEVLATVERTLRYQKGEEDMTDSEKFAAFKKAKVLENEAKYGAEIRQKYGEEKVAASNKQFLNMTEDDIAHMQELEEQLFAALQVVKENGDFTGEAARAAYRAHRDWLTLSWGNYNAEAHLGLVQMYLADERFKAYYDAHGKGLTEVLAEVVTTQINQ